MPGDGPAIVEPVEAETHAGTAYAYLGDAGTRNDWIDARPQNVRVVSRTVDTTSNCSQAVLAEIKILIDALKK